jgi:hypothetical protein
VNEGGLEGSEEGGNLVAEETQGLSEEQARAPEPAGRRGVGGWIAGVFTDPRVTFGEIAEVLDLPHPTDRTKTKDGSRWWIPFVITLVVSTAIAAYTVPKIVMPERMADVRQTMIEQGATQADIDRVMQMSSAVGGVLGIVGVLVVTAIIFFITAGLLHLFARMVGGKGRFRHARAVAAYAMLITTLGSLIKLPMMAAKKTMFVETGLALFLRNAGPSDKLYRFFMAGFDIFTIWWVVVLVFGVAAAYRLPKGKAAVAAGLIWAILAILGTVGEGGGFGG